MRLYLIPIFFSLLILDQINFDSKKAFDSIIEQCSFGPRYPGSSGHENYKKYLIEKISNYSKDIIIDDWEIKKDTPSYSYDTIKHLKIIYPNSYLSMIIGEDQLECFKEWRNYKKILDAVELIVFNRSENKHELIKDIEFRLISDFHVDISSTSIRKNISNGKPLQNDLTPEIYHYIQKNKLYDANIN